MKSPAIYRFIAKNNYIDLLLELETGEQKIKELSRKIGINYAHLTNVLQAMHQEGLINRELIDHQFKINLTRKGRVIVELFRGIKVITEEWDTKELLQRDGDIRSISDSLGGFLHPGEIK